MKRSILIEKLFNRDCSREELYKLLELMNDDIDSTDSKVMERLWKELEETQTEDKEWSDSIFEKTMSKIETSKSNPISLNERLSSPKTSNSRRWFISVASIAAVFILLISGINWIRTSSFFNQNRIVVFTVDASKTIELPDHSIVRLAPHSKLSYFKQWDRHLDREVGLVGEAYFKVKKYPSTGQKFRVVTSDLSAEVLGTSFNVITRNNETEVFLEEGKVSLDLFEEEKNMLMKPGDLITYSMATKEKSKKHISENRSIVWKNDMVTMKDISLADILKNIEIVYDMDFEYQGVDSLSRIYTIGVPSNNFDMTLSVLREVLDLNVIEKEGQYIIQSSL